MNFNRKLLLLLGLGLLVACSSAQPSPTPPLPTEAEQLATPLAVQPIPTEDEMSVPLPVLPPIGDQRVIFSSAETGNDEIYVINTDGSELMQVTTNPEASDRCPAWSPDGSQFAWLQQTGEGDSARSAIFTANRDGSLVGFAEPEDRTDIGFCPIWSPDGQWIMAAHIWGTYIFHPDGSGFVRLPTAPRDPVQWLPDSQAVVIPSADWGLIVVDLEGDFEIVASPISWIEMAQKNFTISPDGDEFIYVDADYSSPDDDFDTFNNDKIPYLAPTEDEFPPPIALESSLSFHKVYWVEQDLVMATAFTEDRQSIYGFSPAGGSVVDYLPGHDVWGAIGISPASKWIAYVENGWLYLLEIQTKSIVPVVEAPEFEGGASQIEWSEDADFLLIRTSEDDRVVVDLNRATAFVISGPILGADIQ